MPHSDGFKTAALEIALTATRRSVPNASGRCHGRLVVSSARRLPIGTDRRERMSANFWSMPRNPVVKPALGFQAIAFLGTDWPRNWGLAAFAPALLGVGGGEPRRFEARGPVSQPD